MKKAFSQQLSPAKCFCRLLKLIIPEKSVMNSFFAIFEPSRLLTEGLTHSHVKASYSRPRVYGIIMVSCFVMMLLATLFSIQIMAYLQIIVPGSLIGKVISCAICIGMCATPLGQVLYGSLFELLKGNAFWLFFVVAALDVMLALKLKKPFIGLAKLVK